MKRKYEFECEVFVSKLLGFGFVVETVLVAPLRYAVKLTKFDPENENYSRVSFIQSTIAGLTFNECCDKIYEFKAKYE